MSIGQSLAGAAKSIDQAFYELTKLHASLNKGGEQVPATNAGWRSPPSSARNVDELSFTSRDPEGRICWWSVTPPKTEYWDAHVALGRAYAYEFLDLVHNNDKTEELHKQAFGSIAGEIVRTGHTMNDGLYCGFFGAISEYLITGRVAISQETLSAMNSATAARLYPLERAGASRAMIGIHGLAHELLTDQPTHKPGHCAGFFTARKGNAPFLGP